MKRLALVVAGICTAIGACQSRSPSSESSAASGGSVSHDTGTGAMGGGGENSSTSDCSEAEHLYLYAEKVAVGGAGGFGNDLEPVVILTDTPSGMTACPGARIDRHQAATCSPPLPVHQQIHCGFIHGGLPEVCDSYVPDSGAGTCKGPDCYVRVGCETDNDCEAGQVCLCSAGSIDGKTQTHIINRCVVANCETDNDCDGLGCGLSSQCRGLFSDWSLHCRTNDDECQSDEDCDGGICYAGPEGKWVCKEQCDD